MPRLSVARSDVGRKRRSNEDFFAIDAERGVYVVADGLGGHVAGRRAAEVAVAAFIDACGPAAGEDSLLRARRAVRAANASIRAQAEAEPELEGMGTTLVALLTDGSRATLAHVGDSRAYLQRDGKLHLLTLDHSRVFDMITYQRVPAERLRGHPHRHVITRALGVQASVEPDVGEFPVRGGDLFLLCTDGLCGALEDTELSEALQEAGDDLEAAAELLIDLANEAGGEDNATALLLRI
jgi:protein phosphatase